MKVIYEDNHLIIVYKEVGEIVQGDKTGDKPLSDIVKEYIKERYCKPGNVFCGVVHRIDRPVEGLVVFARTSKALSRLNDMLRRGDIHKTYWAIVEGSPVQREGTLTCHMKSNEKSNRSYVCSSGTTGAKEARLQYKTVAVGDRYSILEINLLTGRKHQIRLQLSLMGHPIKGDLKYGARRSNSDGGISLMAKRIDFVHPVSHERICVEAEPTPEMSKILNSAEFVKP